MSVLRFTKLALLSSLAAPLTLPLSLCGQGNTADGPVAATTSPVPLQELTGAQVIAKMVENNHLRSERLLGYSAIRKYEIQNSDGRISARAVVQETYLAPSSKSFSKISEQGSGVIRHLVFDRLLQSEEESASQQNRSNGAISPANYEFTFTGTEDLSGRKCYVFSVSPTRVDPYLFEGRIWIDAEDFAIARIEGQPAKKPSFWIKHAEFQRQYQRIDGFWLPWRDETIVDVKANGTKLFRIEHEEYRIQAATAPDRPQMTLAAGK